MTVSTFAERLKELALSVLVIPGIAPPPGSVSIYVDLVALVLLAIEMILNHLRESSSKPIYKHLTTDELLVTIVVAHRFRGEDDA
jgi:hypothetical protein